MHIYICVYIYIDECYHIMSTFNSPLFEYTGDFVSFKLDVDHSDTEMPIALNI
jgi:hypothetical protein